MSLNHAAAIAELTDKLNWLMTQMHMKAMITSGVLGPDGQPVGKVFEGSMLELYHLQAEIPTVTQTEAEPPVLSKEATDVVS